MTNRRGVSLAEVLVALVLVAAAVAALAASVLADARLRAVASRAEAPTQLSRAHVELLATRPCASDTGGVIMEAWGTGGWHASVAGRSYRLEDSTRLVPRAGAARDVVVRVRVACPD